MLLQKLTELILKLQETNSSLEKQKILKQNNTDDISKILYYVYNPDIKFNVTAKRIKEFNKSRVILKNYRLFELLDLLKDRKLTGHDALYSITHFINKNKTYEDTILKILNKDLKIGMNIKQINKVIPNLIQEFSTALAEVYNDKTKQLLNKNKWFISRKLDGIRCICIVKNNKAKFYSRTGKEFNTLNLLKPILSKFNNTVFDGELVKIKDNNEDFQGIMKELHKKNHVIDNMKYYIFDVLSVDEFFNKTSSRIYSQRMNDKPMIKNKYLEYLEQYDYSLDKFKELMELADKNNWEGLMLRKDDIYKGKRSKDLLKVKNFKDAEYKVIDIETGIMRKYDNKSKTYKDIETLTAVNIIHKDNVVSVGSGFSMDERIKFYKNPSEIIDKIITVKYFEESKDQNGKYSLRFPIFKVLHGNKREF